VSHFVHVDTNEIGVARRAIGHVLHSKILHTPACAPPHKKDISHLSYAARAIAHKLVHVREGVVGAIENAIADVVHRLQQHTCSRTYTSLTRHKQHDMHVPGGRVSSARGIASAAAGRW
jgi:hypothetical protein